MYPAYTICTRLLDKEIMMKLHIGLDESRSVSFKWIFKDFYKVRNLFEFLDVLLF